MTIPTRVTANRRPLAPWPTGSSGPNGGSGACDGAAAGTVSRTSMSERSASLLADALVKCRRPLLRQPRAGQIGAARLPCGHRPVSGYLGLEVAEAHPARALIQIHLRGRHRSPVLGVGDRLAAVVEDRRGDP